MHFFNIKYTLILLNIIGSHPGKVGSKFQSFLYYSLFLCVVFVVSLSAMNMFNNNITAVEVATTLAAFFVIFHPATKMHMIYANRSTIWNLLEQMDSKFWTIEDKTNSHTRKYYEKHLTRLKNIFYLFCVTLTTWTMLTVSLSKLPFECYVPKWMPLRSLIILEDVVCVAVCLVLHCTNMLFMTIVTLLALQVRMLSDNFGNIFELEDCDKMTRIELKEWIQHHCFLLKYVDTVNEAFSRGMLVYLGNVVGFLCSYIFILSISDISDVGSVIPIVNVILPGYIEFLYCYCIPAQNLMDEMEKINYTVYLANWVKHLKQSSSVILITVRSQKRVAVTAGSFGELSLETCMRVLNTVVSYYMFLKTMIDA